ncbi:MAG: hypothetical protein LBR08_12135 [Bacteroidales bacterium]|nr:hypothetical protein [Bacteroidales bacterium]
MVSEIGSLTVWNIVNVFVRADAMQDVALPASGKGIFQAQCCPLDHNWGIFRNRKKAGRPFFRV